MPNTTNQNDQATYAIGTIAPAACQPCSSFARTNSRLPIKSASPIGTPIHPSQPGTGELDAHRAAAPYRVAIA